MINLVAKKTVLYMYKNNIVDEKDIEIYEYGAKIFFATLFSVLGACLIATALGELFLGVLFLCVYCSLRCNTGGYHANSFRSCIGMFLILFTITLKSASAFSVCISNEIFVILFIVSNASMILLCGVPNSIEPISILRKKVMKKRAILILNGWYTVIAFMLQRDRTISTAIAFAILLNQLLLLTGKIKNKRRRKYEKI